MVFSCLPEACKWTSPLILSPPSGPQAEPAPNSAEAMSGSLQPLGSLQLDALKSAGPAAAEGWGAEVRSWHKDGWQQAPEVWKEGRGTLMTRGVSLSPPWAFKLTRYSPLTSHPPPHAGPQERCRGQLWEAEPGLAA